MNAYAKPPKTAKNMAGHLKRARNGVKGLTIGWRDSNPMSGNGEITHEFVTHKNPTQRLVVRDMWRKYHDWVLTQEFTWQVDCKVYFLTKDRVKIEEIEVTLTCPLRDMDSKKTTALDDAIKAEIQAVITANDSVPDGHKNKGVYQYVEYVAQIVGI